MLQPETIARVRVLQREAHGWIRTLAELPPEAVLFLKLAQHLDAWRQWAEDLEKELSTP
jgi:hypothetical protein